MIAADLHILLHALSPVDTRESLEEPSLAPHPLHIGSDAGRPNQAGLTDSASIGRDETTGVRGLSQSITHIDGGEARTGINLVPVFGEMVQAVVTYHGFSRTDHYLATEVDYDLGRPSCVAHTPLQALRDLQSMLEDEHLADARRRDADFAGAVARARP